MISEILCYLYFPDGNWPPCWIFKSIKFYMQTWSGGSTHITIPNFLETGLSKADILRFFKFSKWLLPPPSWIFEIAKFYWLFEWRGSRRISMPNFVLSVTVHFIALRLGGQLCINTLKFCWSKSKWFQRYHVIYTLQMAIGHHAEYLKA